MDLTKAELRKSQIDIRMRAFEYSVDAPFEVITRFPDRLWPGQTPIVAGYFPIGTELDPRPLMAEFQARGSRLCLPVMHGREEALSFHQWKLGEDLIQGGFGVHEPDPAQNELIPNLILIPLLAADKQGGRLGYGKGYYDRTLSRLRDEGTVICVGLAFEAQIVDRVPVEPHDQALDWVVTEKSAYKTGA